MIGEVLRQVAEPTVCGSRHHAVPPAALGRRRGLARRPSLARLIFGPRRPALHAWRRTGPSRRGPLRADFNSMEFVPSDEGLVLPFEEMEDEEDANSTDR